MRVTYAVYPPTKKGLLVIERLLSRGRLDDAKEAYDAAERDKLRRMGMTPGAPTGLVWDEQRGRYFLRRRPG